jgi:hypothetical protein
MYSPDSYGNTSFVVFPYFPSVEMTADNPHENRPTSILANMMDYVACCPGRRLAAPDIAKFLEKWKVSLRESRRISFKDVSW